MLLSGFHARNISPAIMRATKSNINAWLIRQIWSGLIKEKTELVIVFMVPLWYKGEPTIMAHL